MFQDFHFLIFIPSNNQLHSILCFTFPVPCIMISGVPRNFVQGGGGDSTNSVEDRGQTKRGFGGGSPPSQGFWMQL